MPDPAPVLHASFTARGPTGLRAALDGPVRDLFPTARGPIPDPLAVGRGQVLWLEGHCFHPRAPVEHLEAWLDGAGHPVVHARRPRPDPTLPATEDPSGLAAGSGFIALVPVPPVGAPRPAALALRARLADGTVHEVGLGAFRVLPRDAVERAVLPPARPGEDGPPVAICLATCEPPLDLLESQLDSLVAQTHRRWICIVNDDASSPERFAAIERLAGRDRRFQVFRNPARLGFFRNFERALLRVPAGAEHVALCDQDDRWYPEKLAASLAALGPGVELAYCDMHVVTRDDRPIADTFFGTPWNNSTDLASLLLKNTVTGAASVFRADLLDAILPFPAPIATPFHDHWIACLALARGRLAYVDRPLYAYRQHGRNALGHPAPVAARLLPRASELLGRIPLGRDLPGALRAAPAAVRALLAQEAHPFPTGPVRIAQLARVLRMRVAPTDAAKAAALEDAASRDASALALARTVVEHRLRRRPSFGEERLHLRALAADRLLAAWDRAARAVRRR